MFDKARECPWISKINKKAPTNINVCKYITRYVCICYGGVFIGGN